MAATDIKVKSIGREVVGADLFEPREKLESTHTSELVIALCGPIGSPLHEVATKIKEILIEHFSYNECRTIRLSDFIQRHSPSPVLKNDESALERIKKLIDSGNELRRKHGRSVLAELAVHQIRVEREKAKESENADKFSPRRVCHIIDSIKNQEELELLKTVYRDMLYVIGVYSPLEKRQINLKKRGMELAEIFQLIDRDSGEEFKNGQTVRDTFPQSDFFLRVDSGTDAQLTRRVERFLHLILGTKILTPTWAETAMYAAASAAGNSACLSRQVGAAITDSTGSVLSVGWNDVPKGGGGLYAFDPTTDPGQDHDKRCWNRDGGKCFNDDEKSLLVEVLIKALVDKDLIAKEDSSQAMEVLKANSKVKGLIEFSRSIHAEMHAILNTVKTNGAGMVGGHLFVTTFPCHSCARHIIAAGIKEIYYIEPYRKSLATKLHDDSISENEVTTGSMVKLLPYDGVAPTKYLSLFRVKQDTRKQDGRMIKVIAKEAMPRLEKSLEALPALEGIVVKGLLSKKLIDKMNLNNEEN